MSSGSSVVVSVVSWILNSKFVSVMLVVGSFVLVELFVSLSRFYVFVWLVR